MVKDYTAKRLSVLASEVMVGDVIEVAGILHVIRDVRRVRSVAVYLRFEDGNQYVTSLSSTMQISRTFTVAPPAAARHRPPRSVRPPGAVWPGRRPPRS